MSSPLSLSAETWFSALRREWGTHWRIGAAAFIGGAVSLAIFSSSMSIFIPYWEEEFRWSRGEILFAGNASILVAFLAPFAGRAIDAIGAKPVIIAGILLSAAAYLGLSLMGGSLWYYYGVYLLLVIGGLGTGAIAYSNAISRVFIHTRGFSLALVRSGVALGSGITPPLIFYIISTDNWRSALLMLVALLLCVGLPAVWFWMRLPPVANARATPGVKAAPRARVMFEPRFFRLAAGTSLNYVPVFVLLSQLHPMLVAKGLDDGVAAGFVGALGVAALAGGWLAGYLIDRIWAPAISATFSVGAAIGCAILLLGPASYPLMLLAIILIGNAYGAEHDMAPFLIAKYFGLERFSHVYGVIFLFFSIGAAGFSWLSGIMFDLTGQYTIPIVFALLCFSGAAIAHLTLGPYPSRREDGEHGLETA